MPTGKQGVVGASISGTQYIPSGRTREAWNDTIYTLNISKSPLLYLTSKLKKKPSPAMKFNWMNEERFADQVVCTAAATGNWASTAADDGTVTVGSSNAYLFAESDLFMIPELSTSQVFYVDSVVQATGVITASTVDGETIDLSALVSGYATYHLLRLGNANDTGSGIATLKSQQPAELYNYLQIFQTPFGITTTDDAADFRGIDEWARLTDRSGIEHAFGIEKTLFFGTRYVNSSSKITNGSRYQQFFTGGLRYWIDTNVNDVDGGALTRGDFADMVSAWVKNADQPIIFAGDMIYDALTKWSEQFLRVDQKTNVLGMSVNQFKTSKGKVIGVVPHSELLTGGLEGMAFGADLSDLTYRFLEGKDTHLEKDLQPNDEKIREAEFRTWCGLEVGNEKRHMVIENVASISMS